MSLLQKQFLGVSFQNAAVTMYSQEVVPRLTKKNKVIAISVAVFMSLVYLVTDKIMKPPRKLRHIPHVSYYSVIKSLLMKESNWDRAYRLHLSEVNKKEHGGLLLVNISFGRVTIR